MCDMHFDSQILLNYFGHIPERTLSHNHAPDKQKERWDLEVKYASC